MKMFNSSHRLILLITVLCVGSSSLGCSSFQKKMFGAMAIVGGGAAAAAYPLTPQGTSPGAHSVYWGAIGAAVAAAASTYVFDPKEEDADIERDVRWRSSLNSDLREPRTAKHLDQPEVSFENVRHLSALSAFRSMHLSNLPVPVGRTQVNGNLGNH